MKKQFNKKTVLKALETLDSYSDINFELLIAGGAAMICSYEFPLGTADVDAVLRKAELSQADVYIKKTAAKLSLIPNWLNMWMSSFTHYLPDDYEDRLNLLFKGTKITAKTFGKEDMLILKCFAHRAKDAGHVKALIKRKADIDFAENHIKGFVKKKFPESRKALDFLYDILDEAGL